jgi:hypothetical protein
MHHKQLKGEILNLYLTDLKFCKSVQEKIMLTDGV